MSISLNGGLGAIGTNTVTFAGNTSGTVLVQANDIAGTIILTLPTVNGNLVIQRSGASISNGSVLIGNTVSGSYDVNTLTQGSNILITNDKGSITIAATASPANSFSTISIAGQTNVVADASADTLTIIAGNNVVLVTDATTDTITISVPVGQFYALFNGYAMP